MRAPQTPATPVAMLDHINMTVTNLDASTAWYRSVFGFEQVEGGMYEGHPWAIVRAQDALLCLYERPDRHVPTDEELVAARLHSVSHFGLRVPDRAAWEARVAESGVDVLYGGTVAWPHATAWYVKDPDGNEIEVSHWHEGVPRFDSEVEAASS